MTLTVVAELGSSACPAEKGVCVRCPEPNYWAPASCRAAPPENKVTQLTEFDISLRGVRQGDLLSNIVFICYIYGYSFRLICGMSNKFLGPNVP